MQQIGYSLVSTAGEELAFWGDIEGRMEGIPGIVHWPNGDHTQCPEVGMSHGGATLVPRMLVTADSDSKKFDGKQMMVYRAAARRPVPKTLIIDRLHEAGLLDKAMSVLDGSDIYTRERWNAQTSLYSDDAATLALLTAIGADPAIILAP